MAPDVLLRNGFLAKLAIWAETVARPGTHKTEAARRQGHFGLKSAPQHRDFRPGKVEVFQ